MNSMVVHGLIKRVYSNFNLSNFDDRIKLQKMIYLIQAYVVNLGFSFSLYLRGPYSPSLTKIAFIGNFNEAKPVYLEDPKIENKFKRFLKLILPHKDDIKFLEVASTLHMISKSYKKDIIKRVEKLKKVPNKYVKDVYAEMEKWK